MGQRARSWKWKGRAPFAPVGAGTVLGPRDPSLPGMGGEFSGHRSLDVKESHFRSGAAAGWALQLVSRWRYWASVSGPSRLVNNLRAAPQDFGCTLEGKCALHFLLSSSASPFNSTRLPCLERESPPRPSLFLNTSNAINVYFSSCLLILPTPWGWRDMALDSEFLRITECGFWFVFHIDESLPLWVAAAAG